MKTFGEFCEKCGLEPLDGDVKIYLKYESYNCGRDKPAEGLYLKGETPCGCDGSRPCKTNGANCVLAWKSGNSYVPFEKISFDNESQYTGETYRCDDTIVCPYCGYRIHDAHELFGYPYANDDSEEECENCGEQFNVTKEIEVSYTAEIQEGRYPLKPARFVGDNETICNMCKTTLTDDNFTHKCKATVNICNDCYSIVRKMIDDDHARIAGITKRLRR